MWRGALLRRSCSAHSTFDVPGSGGAKLSAWHLAPPEKHGENASFAHNFCANGPILKILTVLESACLVPKLMKSSRYHMTYVAWGSTAKKLRCAFSSMLGICHRARAARKTWRKRFFYS